MSWKTVVVKNTNKIFLKNNQLAFSQDEKTTLVPLHDLDCVVLENNYTYLTSQLLAKLAAYNVFVLVCDNKHDPTGVFLPFSNHWKPLMVLELQLKMKVHFKKQIWTKLIKHKLLNSAMILEKLAYLPQEVKKLTNLAKYIEYNDYKNHEGYGARVFYRCLYGSSFIRHADDGINSALNYGYKILMSAITRSCAKYGLNNYLGVHHHGQTNPFNLSCDLIEPLRPLVDYFVKSMGETVADSLTYNQRLELIKVLHYKVMINNQIRTVTNAIETMTKSFLSALKETDSNLIFLPKILKTENVYDQDLELD